jgi:hypothetical protein
MDRPCLYYYGPPVSLFIYTMVRPCLHLQHGKTLQSDLNHCRHRRWRLNRTQPKEAMPSGTLRAVAELCM